MSEEEQKAIEMLDKFITEHELFNIKQADNLEGNIKIALNYIDRLQKELKDSINARFELQRSKDKLEQENKDLEVTCNCQLQEIDTLNFVLKERRKKIKSKIKELEALKQGTTTLSNEYLQILGGIKYLEELLEEGIDSE